MSRFFARFNNYCDIENPGSIHADILAKLEKCDKAELECLFAEFESVQNRRAECLKEKFGEAFSKYSEKRILFLGDSITKDNLSYRAAVTRAANLKARNLAVSGATSPMLLYSAKVNLKSFCPDLVSLLIGGNDSTLIGRERLEQVSLSEYKRNVSAMVRWSKEAGAEVLLFEICPVHEARFEARYSTREKFHSNENIKRYNDALYEIAKEYHIPLHSNQWLLEDPDLYYEPDGIHLTETANEVYAEKWLFALTKLGNGE
jgi:lysophospholipase L1-like esterase